MSALTSDRSSVGGGGGGAKADRGGFDNLSDVNPLQGMSKKQKLAALLVVLGPEVASTLLNDFEEREVEEISSEMVKIDFVAPPMREALLEEFSPVCVKAVTSLAGGASYAKRVLEKAIGNFKANELISRVAPNRVHSVDTGALRDIPVRQLVSMLRKEQLQTWALVLSFLEPTRTAEALALMQPEFRTDVVERIATMEPTPSEVVEQVITHIQRRSNLRNRQNVTSSGGTKNIADILNSLDDSTSKQVLTSLEERNPELSRIVKKQLFVFEDIAALDKASLQKVLREVDFHLLAMALKTASEKLKDTVMSALTKRASEIIMEEIEYMPPVRLAEVEHAQEQIIEQMRRLEANGEITISSKGDGDVVV